MKLLFTVIAGFLVFQANAGGCTDCDSKGCEAPALQVAPTHRTENFDIIEPAFEVKDFQIEKPVREATVFNDAERRAQNDARYNQNQVMFANRLNAVDVERDQALNRVMNIAAAQEDQMSQYSVKQIELPKVNVRITEPEYYKPGTPQIFSTGAITQKPMFDRVYQFDERQVCSGANCPNIRRRVTDKTCNCGIGCGKGCNCAAGCKNCNCGARKCK